LFTGYWNPTAAPEFGSVENQEAKTMSQRDLWDKAAACARAANASSDPERCELLLYLGQFWVNLANVDPFLDDDMAVDIAMIERVQVELLGRGPTSH
jgi:hypothetical protein